MASDDLTSQDSIVIGDDLVEALGFEPIVHDATPTYVAGDEPQVSSVDSDFPSVALLSSIDATEPDTQDRASHEAEAVPEMAIDERVETDRPDATTHGVPVQHDGPGSLADKHVVDGGVIDLSDAGTIRRAVFGRFAARQRGSVEPDPTESDASTVDDIARSGYPADADELAEAGVHEENAEAAATELAGAEGRSSGSEEETLAPPPTLDSLITSVAVDPSEMPTVGEIEIETESIEIPRYEFPDLVMPEAPVVLEDIGGQALAGSPEIVVGQSSGDGSADEALLPMPELDLDAVAPDLTAPPVIDLPEVAAPTIDLDRIEHPSTAPADALSIGVAPAAAPAEVVLPSSPGVGFGRRRQRLRARKTRRVIRHIDPWSALKFSIIFHLCFYAALLLASVLVWNAAVAAGTIENIESFIRELGDYERFEIDSNKVFTAAMLIAGMLTLASTIMVVLLTVVFNLISDLVGGIRVTVIEEDTVRVGDPHATA